VADGNLTSPLDKQWSQRVEGP